MIAVLMETWPRATTVEARSQAERGGAETVFAQWDQTGVVVVVVVVDKKLIDGVGLRRLDLGRVKIFVRPPDELVRCGALRRSGPGR